MKKELTLLEEFTTYLKDTFLFDTIEVIDLNNNDLDMAPMIDELYVYNFFKYMTKYNETKETAIKFLKYNHNQPKILVLSHFYQSGLVDKKAVFICESNNKIIVPLNYNYHSEVPFDLDFNLSKFTLEKDNSEFHKFLSFSNGLLSCNISQSCDIDIIENIIKESGNNGYMTINRNRSLELIFSEYKSLSTPSSFTLSMYYNNSLIKFEELYHNILDINRVNLYVKHALKGFKYPYTLKIEDFEKINVIPEFTESFVKSMIGDYKNILEMIKI